MWVEIKRLWNRIQGMDEQPSLKILLVHFDWSVRELQEILGREKTDYYRDASLQRFGFTFSLGLKCIRAAAGNDPQCETPHQCFQLAAEKGWLDESADWKNLMASHEKTDPSVIDSHADAVYKNLAVHLKDFQGLHAKLSVLAEK